MCWAPKTDNLQASAAVATSITALSLNNTALIYGQTESFGTQVQVPLGSPVPQGGIVSFLNGTQVLATAFLNGTGVRRARQQCGEYLSSLFSPCLICWNLHEPCLKKPIGNGAYFAS